MYPFLCHDALEFVAISGPSLLRISLYFVITGVFGNGTGRRQLRTWMACTAVLMVILTIVEACRGYHTFDKLCLRVTRCPTILDGFGLQEVHLGRCQHRTDEVIITRIGTRIKIRIVTFSPFQLATFVPIR